VGDVEHVGAVPEEDNRITWTAIEADMEISTVSMFCVVLKQGGGGRCVQSGLFAY
jgi:hypothetical protein